MKKIEIHPKEVKKTSQIFIGAGALEQIGSLFALGHYSKIFVLTDKNIAPLLLDKLLHALPVDTTHLIVAPGEQAKKITVVQEIWQAMHHADCDRNALVVNLGGGVICDMGGFAASTYMRGVDFVQIPTTLLAQVDASVGGKTGIDFGGIKNLIGTFDQPRAVIIDPSTLTSLPEREFVAGFGEIIKHGLISSQAYLEKVTKKPPLEFDMDELEEIIAESCQIKVEVVRKDVTEGGFRKTVNFGHTVGHAIEALSLKSAQPLLHGEAVSIGMVVEAELSQQKNFLSARDAGLVSEYLDRAGLPIAIPSASISDLMELMRSDKKNQAGRLRFTLLDGIGKAVYDQEINPQLVEAALKKHMERG